MRIRTHGLTAALVVLLVAARAGAHAGPPYPIIVDQPAGPCVVSVWGDPDIGVGTFYVTIDAPPGGAIPDDLAVDMVIRPVNGRLPEARYPLKRDTSQSRVQFWGEAEFDRQEMWSVRFLLQSSAGSGEVGAEVEATPPGLGPFDILLYLMPFLAVAFLWARAIFRRRAVAKTRRT